MLKILTIFAISFMICGGCAKNPNRSSKLPFVYRVDVQQGNVVDQAMINKLKPGMDKKQVRFIMGTPLLQDPFHSNRWDYLYSYEPGGGERIQRHITLHFKDDKLSRITGDVEVSHAPITTEEDAKGKTVVVPLEDHEEGFFSKLFGKSPEAKSQEDETEVTETIQDSAEQPVESTLTEPTEDTALIDDEQKLESTPEEETEPDVALEDETEEPIPEIKKAEKKEKGLLRRIWDRVTTSEEDSTDENQETERDRRDAEVYKDVGGGLGDTGGEL
jgi:outer membrane protein assembly factor BamE